MRRAPIGPRALLWLASPSHRRDDLLGDLNETYSRRLARMGRFAAWLTAWREALTVAVVMLGLRNARNKSNSSRSLGHLSVMRNMISASEVRLGARLIAKHPVVTITSVVALAVGIGVASVGFTLLEALVSSSLPYENGDRFVIVAAYQEPAGSRVSVGAARYQMLIDRADRFEHVGAMSGTRLNAVYAAEDDVHLVDAALLTPESFGVVAAVPLVGRLLNAHDAFVSTEPVAVISEAYWERQFGRSDAVIGSQVVLGTSTRTIVGVMPETFKFPNAPEVWLPLAPTNIGSATVFAVLGEGVSIAQASQQVTSLFAVEVAPGEDTVRPNVYEFTALPPGAMSMGVVFLVVLLLVLLVIAANVANLILARTLTRRMELAVRSALGAHRLRLIGQVFVETLMLGMIAAMLGLAVALPVFRMVVAGNDELPFWMSFEPNVLTVVFVVLATIMVAGVAGVLPALKVTRRDVARELGSSDQSRSVTGVGSLGRLMIVVEMALSVALLCTAVAVTKGFQDLVHPDLGIDESRTLAAWVNLASPPTLLNQTDGQRSPMERRETLLDAIRRVPGVVGAAAGTAIPRTLAQTQRIALDDSVNASQTLSAPVARVTASFFEVLGARVVAGRTIRLEDEIPGAAPVAVVNEPFVARAFAGRNPLGQRVGLAAPDGTTRWHEVVGVVPDVGLSLGDAEFAAGLYVPMETEDYFYVTVRTVGDPMTQVVALRRAIVAADPFTWFNNPQPLTNVGSENAAFLVLAGWLLTGLGMVSLVLSVAGVYAIVAFSVTQRTREIGIRVSLGAMPGVILKGLLTRVGIDVVVGAVFGVFLAQALLVMRGMFTFRIGTPSVGVFAAVVLVFLLAAALACFVPARRALRVSPVEALRVS